MILYSCLCVRPCLCQSVRMFVCPVCVCLSVCLSLCGSNYIYSSVCVYHYLGIIISGIEPMGLFWSLQPPQITPRPDVRLKKDDVTQPHRITLSVLAGHIDAEKITLHADAGALAKIELHRYYALPDVLRVPVRHGKVRGTLFMPQSKCVKNTYLHHLIMHIAQSSKWNRAK